MVLAGFFIPGGVSQQSLSFWDSKELFSLMPQVFFKLLLLYCLCGLFVVLCLEGWGLSFLSPFWLSRSQDGWFLRFQALSLAGCKSSQNLALLDFKARRYGDLTSPGRLPSVIAYFFPLSIPVAPSLPPRACGPLTPHCLCPSYLFLCGLFSTLSCRVFFFQSSVHFWITYMDNVCYLVV